MSSFYKSKFFLFAFSLVLCLGGAEFALRQLGARPGVYQLSREFKVVDSLVLYKNFEVDEAGIYKFSSWVSDSVPLYTDKKSGLIVRPSVRGALANVDKVDMVYPDFLRIIDSSLCQSWRIKFFDWSWDNDHQSQLKATYHHLVKKEDKSAWAKSIVDYVHRPFNAEGFRSIPFRNDTTDRPKILVIGDSYVYGLIAMPFHASFVDNLLAKGYMVYAAGIPGTDPSQYAAIAQKYIPIIQPDLVVMCFYEGNDYMLFDRPSTANRPIEYLTNAGFYQSSPYGQFLTVDSCYRYYASLITIPDLTTHGLNKVLSTSALGSLLWGFLLQREVVQHPALAASHQAIAQLQQAFTPQITAKYIQQFDSACRAHRVPVLYTAIPDQRSAFNKDKPLVTADTAKLHQVFGSLPVYQSYSLHSNTDFGKKNSHFSKAGAAVFSSFLDSCLQRELLKINRTLPKP